MKLSLFLLCFLFSAITAKIQILLPAGSNPIENLGPGNDVQTASAEVLEEGDLNDGIFSDEAATASSGTDGEPFRYRPSRRLKEASDAMPEDMKRPIANGQANQAMADAVAKAMSGDAAVQGLAGLKHEWGLMVAGPEAARVVGTTGANVKRLLTSPNGSEFVSTALATVHVLLSKAGNDNRDSGLGRVVSAAFLLFASPAMPDTVNKAGGLLLTAVLKPNAALVVRRFWNEVRISLNDQQLANKLGRCGNNLASLMKTFHAGDKNRLQQTPAARSGGSRTRK